MTRLAIPLLLWTSGCASLQDTGPTREATFLSDPQGATVRVVGEGEEYVGMTPCTHSLTITKKYVVTYRLDGYEPQTQELEATYNPLTLGNAAIGVGLGVIGVGTGGLALPVVVLGATSVGIGVDVVNDAHRSLRPESVTLREMPTP